MKQYTLKELRLKNKITQEEVAKRAGITKDYVSMLERGERRPSDKLKSILANIYNVDSVQIFLATQRTIGTIKEAK